MSGWQPIETAPKDGRYILVVTGEIPDERWSHLSGRMFVTRHLGRTSRLRVDMGWALYPGMAVGDEWLAAWQHAPELPTPANIPAVLKDRDDD